MIWQTRFGKCLYTSPSGYQVFQNPLFRWLTFGSPALQSVIFRPFPTWPVLHYLKAITLAVRHHPGTCCLFGLGGAGIPQLLAGSNTPITAIELSDEVIDIANRYFYTRSLVNLEVLQDNALDYLRKTSHRYTHLLIDLYDACNFPADCATEAFFALCKSHLEDQGILAVNLANAKEQYAVFELIKSQFANTLVIPAPNCSNIIVFAAHTEDKEYLYDFFEKTGEIKRAIWLEKWGRVAFLKR